jgi:hypothetical protein
MTANPDLQYRRKTKSDLVHLRTLPNVEPATSTGRVAWIWPEIEAALAAGKKLREVFRRRARRWARHSLSSVSRLRVPAAKPAPVETSSGNQQAIREGARQEHNQEQPKPCCLTNTGSLSYSTTYGKARASR